MNSTADASVYEYAGSRGPAVLAVTATMISLSTIFVFLRMVSRAGVLGKVTADDYVILVAWALAFGLSFSICYATKFGLGMHEVDIPASTRSTLSKLEYVFTTLYNPAIMATKTSICIFYLSLAQGAQRTFKWATIGTLFIVNAAGIALTLICLFQCRPLNVLFLNPRPPGSNCIDIVTLYLSSAPVNIATDLFLLLLPMPLLKSMRLPRKQKIILYITFGFGVFVAAVDVVRISYLQSASIVRLREIVTGQSSSSQNANVVSDFSWYASLTFVWSAIEVNVGIMCASVPALKPLVARIMPRMLKDSISASGTEKHNSMATLGSQEMRELQRIPSLPQSPTTLAPPPVAHRGPPSDDEIGFLDFLTTPDTPATHQNVDSQLERTDTVRALAPTVRTSTPTFFDFVNIGAEKSVLQYGNKDSVRPIAEVTALFFLWGFAYGLLNTLNAQFQLIARMTNAQTLGIHAAYWAAYLVGPLTFGRFILKKSGFKACYIVGLIIYGTGALVFWPAGVLTSFPAFLVSNFITGLGISILELGANPFITLIGPPEYAELRLNMSQGIQAIGTVISPLIAKKALFNNVLDAPSLIDVQWTYLAISIFCYFLAFVYYLLKIPEVTDEELEHLAWNTHTHTLDDLREKHVLWYTLAFCAFGQFIYVGVQEAAAVSLSSYVQEISGGTDPTDYAAIGHALFAFSRLLAAVSGFLIKPRFQLFLFVSGTIIFSALAMNLTGKAGCAMVLMVYFFEGPLFPLFFSIPIRGLGKYTKDSAAILIAATSGGAVFPPIMHAVAVGHSWRYSYSVCVALFATCLIPAIYLNVIPLAKIQVDPVSRTGRKRNYSNATSSALHRVSNITRRHTKGKVDAECSSGEIDYRKSGSGSGSQDHERRV